MLEDGTTKDSVKVVLFDLDILQLTDVCLMAAGFDRLGQRVGFEPVSLPAARLGGVQELSCAAAEVEYVLTSVDQAEGFFDSIELSGEE